MDTYSNGHVIHQIFSASIMWERDMCEGRSMFARLHGGKLLRYYWFTYKETKKKMINLLSHIYFMVKTEKNGVKRYNTDNYRVRPNTIYCFYQSYYRKMISVSINSLSLICPRNSQYHFITIWTLYQIPQEGEMPILAWLNGG